MTKKKKVEFLITDDVGMVDLNTRTFGKRYPTDVISYPIQTDDQDGAEIVGQIVIDAEEVKRNAKSFKTTYELEFARVVTHGILHLLGYIDDTPDGKALMKGIEDSVINTYTQQDNGLLALDNTKDE